MAVATNKIGTVTGRFNDFIRATFAIGEFSDGAGGSVTVDLDSSHDEVTDGVGSRRARFVGTFTMDGAAFFSEET